jgi:hypothetical protein
MNPPGVDDREHLAGIFRVPWGDFILYRVDEFGKSLLYSGSIRRGVSIRGVHALSPQDAKGTCVGPEFP